MQISFGGWLTVWPVVPHGLSLLVYRSHLFLFLLFQNNPSTYQSENAAIPAHTLADIFLFLSASLHKVGQKRPSKIKLLFALLVTP